MHSEHPYGRAAFYPLRHIYLERSETLEGLRCHRRGSNPRLLLWYAYRKTVQDCIIKEVSYNVWNMKKVE